MSEARCEDCGRQYGDEFGFPDLVVSHETWEDLMPGRGGGGLLCPSCMCSRAHNLGISAQAMFTSGPFLTRPTATERERDEARAEVERLKAAADEFVSTLRKRLNSYAGLPNHVFEALMKFEAARAALEGK